MLSVLPLRHVEARKSHVFLPLVQSDPNGALGPMLFWQIVCLLKNELLSYHRKRFLLTRVLVVPIGVSMKSVLLVDLPTLSRHSLAAYLARVGYSVILASSGRSAIERVRGLTTPLVAAITDVKLPDMGGSDLTEALRSMYPAVPVIYTTADTSISLVASARADGCVLLHKPINLKLITQALDGFGSKSTTSTPSTRNPACSQSGFRMTRPSDEEAVKDAACGASRGGERHPSKERL